MKAAMPNAQDSILLRAQVLLDWAFLFEISFGALQRFAQSTLQTEGKIGRAAEEAVKQHIRKTMRPTAGKTPGGVPVEAPSVSDTARSVAL